MKVYTCPGCGLEIAPGHRAPGRLARRRDHGRGRRSGRHGGTGTRTAGRSARERADGGRRGGVELPARREDIELHTADGLTLVGELALPLDRDPVATLVCLHPLPTHGGFMDSHILRKAAARLPALADLAVLRFNFRGVTSPRGHVAGRVRPRHPGAARPGRGDGPRAPRAACRPRGCSAGRSAPRSC